MAEPLTSARPSPNGSREAAGRCVAFWACVLTGLGLLAGVILSGPYTAVRSAERRLASARSGNHEIARVNAHLRAEVEALTSDAFYAEQAVRADLSWQRAGERVVRLSAHAAGDVPAPPPPPAPEGWLGRAAERLARDRRPRGAALLAAGLLLCVAFVCFGEPRRQPCPAEAREPLPNEAADPGMEARTHLTRRA